MLLGGYEPERIFSQGSDGRIQGEEGSGFFGILLNHSPNCRDVVIL
jgi:hypothetical protein